MATKADKKQKAIRDELMRLAIVAGGLLSPEAVVDAAQDDTSPLHDCFEWDDTDAARLYRIEQARRLIRVQVEVIPAHGSTKAIEVQAFTSLPSDRPASWCGGYGKAGSSGGYRLTKVVMSNDTHRKELLDEAKADASRFAAKYRNLVEAADAVRAMRRLAKARR